HHAGAVGARPRRLRARRHLAGGLRAGPHHRPAHRGLLVDLRGLAVAGHPQGARAALRLDPPAGAGQGRVGAAHARGRRGRGRLVVDALTDHFSGRRVDKVLGMEARGFIVAAPVAYRLGAGFVPVRKAGKLPWRVEKEEYVLEYGTDLLEVHTDAVAPGERVV